jgi:hypothetical protein
VLAVHHDRQLRAVGLVADQDDLLARAAQDPARRDRLAHSLAVAIDHLHDAAAERDGQARHRAVETGRQLPARMPDHVLEDERRAVGVGGLADVGRDLELRADGLIDAHELAGAREGVEVGAEVGHDVQIIPRCARSAICSLP